MFHLGIITDEIDDDLERALEVAAELGVRHVEINGLWGRGVTELNADEIDRAAGLIEAGGWGVCCVGTPAFKSVSLEESDRILEHPEVAAHLEVVRRGCDLARRFGAPLVRIFSFRRAGMVGLGNPSPRLPRGGPIPGRTLGRIAEGLRRAGEIAGAAGVTLAVENVRSCWGNSCWNAARIVEATAHANVRMVWDPGNDYVSGGDPFPEGYEAAQPWMAHVHLKNAAVVDSATGLTRWERMAGGDLRYGPMLSRLAADGYAGVACLETHWRGPGLTAEESTRRSFADLVAILGRSARARSGRGPGEARDAAPDGR